MPCSPDYEKHLAQIHCSFNSTCGGIIYCCLRKQPLSWEANTVVIYKQSQWTTQECYINLYDWDVLGTNSTRLHFSWAFDFHCLSPGSWKDYTCVGNDITLPFQSALKPWMSAPCHTWEHCNSVPLLFPSQSLIYKLCYSKPARICSARQIQASHFPNIPCWPHQPSQQRPFFVIGKFHHSWSLKPLPNPIALLYIIDKHEFQPNVSTVSILHCKTNTFEA